MEISVLINFIKKKARSIVFMSVVGAVLGALVFFAVPPRFQATGSFYVSRSTEGTSPDFFAYEGYYAQQAAVSYSKTLAALIESEDIRSSVLESLGREVSGASLRNLRKNLRVQKPDAQLVEVSIRSNDPAEAQMIWNTYSSVIDDRVNSLNRNGDVFLSVSPVLDQPVVTQTYWSLGFNIFVGFLFGMILAIFYYSTKLYLKLEK